MARLAKTNSATKTARLRLEPDKYHFTTVAPRVALGYIRAGAAPAAGRWVVRVELGQRTDTGSQQRVRRTIGIADDLQAAHTYDQARNLPAESRVIDYATAVRIASAFDPSDPDSIPAPRGERLTVERATQGYLEHLKAQKGDSAERDARNKIAVHVLPKLGHIAVADLTLERLRKWQAGLVRDGDADAQRRSRSTANRVVHTFKAALNFAFRGDSGRIPTDRAWRSLKTFQGADGSRGHHFSEQQVQALINAARKQDPAFANLLEAGFWSGARYGEITRLLVGNFDARRRHLLFPSRITKTAKARTVLLVPEACEFFSRIAKGRDKGEVLMLRADGEPWGKSHQARPMKAALRAARLNGAASYYAIRHSVASRMIENGSPMTLVAQQLGTSVVMLERTYAHLLAEKERQLVNATAPRLTMIKGGRRAA